jgi:hypothetical protein
MLRSFFKLSNGKALGIDGFPIEFNILLKPNIKDVYMDLFDECLHMKELSLSMGTSIVILIYKKVDRKLIKNINQFLFCV